MRAIIAGSQSATKEQVYLAMQLCPLTHLITEGVCGMAPGADLFGKEWCDERGIPVKPFQAAWDDISVPGAIVRKRRSGGLYNAAAGPIRNRAMADYASERGMLICTWNGVSSGSRDMIVKATIRLLYSFVLLTSEGRNAEKFLRELGIEYRKGY